MEDWQCVGLDGPSLDATAIKRAYAKRLRATRPDDDPQGYQALREAYDRLLADAKHTTDIRVRVRDTDGDAMERQPEPLGHGLHPEPHNAWLSPQDLCAGFVEAFQAGGATAAEARLPELMHELHALPLQAQDEASVRFAEAVIAHRDLPAAVQVALRDHFGWLSDFRAARLLGPQRANALAYFLTDLVAPETDPEVLGRFSDVLDVARLIKRGHRGLARLLATLTDEAVRQQLAAVIP